MRWRSARGRHEATAYWRSWTASPCGPTSYALTVLYEHELANGASLNTNITYRGVDDQNLTVSSFPDVELGYELLDATITYDAGDWSVALIGRNLTDEEYRTHSLTSVRFQGWGDPATWMLELRNSW